MSRPGAGHGEGWSPGEARGARPAITTTSPAAGGVRYMRTYVLSTLGKNVWSAARRKNFSGAGTAFVAGVAGVAVPAFVAGVAGVAVPAVAGGAFVGDGEVPWRRRGVMATVL